MNINAQQILVMTLYEAISVAMQHQSPTGIPDQKPLVYPPTHISVPYTRTSATCTHTVHQHSACMHLTHLSTTGGKILGLTLHDQVPIIVIINIGNISRRLHSKGTIGHKLFRFMYLFIYNLKGR